MRHATRDMFQKVSEFLKGEVHGNACPHTQPKRPTQKAHFSSSVGGKQSATSPPNRIPRSTTTAIARPSPVCTQPRDDLLSRCSRMALLFLPAASSVDYKLLEDMHSATASKFAELSTKAQAVSGGMAALKVRCCCLRCGPRSLLLPLHP